MQYLTTPKLNEVCDTTWEFVGDVSTNVCDTTWEFVGDVSTNTWWVHP